MDHTAANAWPRQCGHARGPRKIPGNIPFVKCNGVSVPVVAVDDTPASGFTGADALRFEEIDGAHRDVAFAFALTVK
ncbi:MAG TPA: hypothetical protein VK726_23980 [Acetobacteraceae bacterium]|nr:hypothetical protein [Acetobacteraceae bacterium]